MNQSLTQEAKAARMTQADQLLISIILKNTKLNQEQIDQALADVGAAKKEGRDLDLAHAILEHEWLSRAELYNEQAAETVWKRMEDLFAKCLK